jgi:hypothetical protein
MSIARMRNSAVLVICIVGCSGGAPRVSAPETRPRPEARSGPPARVASGSALEAPFDPEQALGSADALRRDQLAVGVRDDRFATDRQVVELRKAIALYQQFIDRAAGDPRYLEAVRRSQGRIDDAEQTIAFLLGEGAGAK